MKAVILAAGKGTRMRELTNELPKPMLKHPALGKPILELILEGIIAAGIHDIFIVTGWRAEVIENHFGDGKKFGARIVFGRQTVQDGTGKAPELAKDFIGDPPFLLTYGDILVPAVIYRQAVNFFESGNFDGLVSVTPGKDVTKYGLFLFDEQFLLRELIEKPRTVDLDRLQSRGWFRSGEPVWLNAGIYIFRPRLFEFTAQLKKSARNEYELTDAIREMALANQRITGFKIESAWADVRDPEALAKLESGM